MATDRTEFDAQRAKAWKMEVDAEFAAVKVLLKKAEETEAFRLDCIVFRDHRDMRT